MAQLKDSLITGDLRVTGKIYGFVNIDASQIVSGTLPATRGGTGKTSLKDAGNAILNALDTGSSTPVDADYYISQYVGGGTTTTTYHRRPVSALWTYIKGKADSTYLKLSGGTLTGPLIINGNAADTPLKTRGIDGSNGSGSAGDLYINYHGGITYFGTSGGATISADGKNYSGNAATANLLKPIASTTTASASTWSIPSGSKQVWGERFSDSTLKYTPSGGSATTITDTGDWTMWLTPNATSNAATLNMRIDGTYYGSFSGNLSGNASSATTATKATQDGDGKTISSTYLKLTGGTLTGQLYTSFKSSVAMGTYGPSVTTVPNLCAELRYSSGAAGSANITTAYTLNGITVPIGWYNFLWIPHRSGGVNGAASGDNCNYGTLILTGMTVNNSYRIRYASSAIASIRNLDNISWGTGTPSGGSSGDIYIQYS